MDRVFIDGIKVTATHGVLASEKVNPQPFEIDITVYGDFRSAGREDSLGLAVDYSELGDIAVQVAKSTSFNLIEALAETLAERALALPRVFEVEVTVKKLQPPVRFSANHVGVTIRRRNG